MSAATPTRATAHEPGTEQVIIYTFGPFRLSPAEQLLLRGDAPVRLGGRALEILTALVEQAGEVVSQDDLIGRAWPRTHVDRSNLKVNVAAIRRALAGADARDRYIVTVNGHGYRFVAPVQTARPREQAGRRHALPPAPRLVGRDEDAAAVAERLRSHPLVTVTGPGGIGKTSLAVAVAHAAASAFPDGAWLLDLGALDSARYIASALAHRLGLVVPSDDPDAALVAAIAGRQMLLVFDCCENSLDEAARLVDLVTGAAPDTRVLATSREPLRVAGECVHPLDPLPVPPAGALTAGQALAFAAVGLFVERAAQGPGRFALRDADAPAVAAICRRLDGLPLALELAATRLDAFSPGDLLALLSERVALLDGGRRAGPARQRSLSATLDWSHDLLCADERAVFRRLSVFPGPFTLASARAVGDLGGGAGPDVVGVVAALVAKSLLATGAAGPDRAYRFLDTTRAYALRRLSGSGEWDAAHRRHAERCRELCRRRDDGPGEPWPSDGGQGGSSLGDDLRSALDWALSERGDGALALSLTAAAIPVWERLSFVQELVDTVERALALLPGGTAGPDDRTAVTLRVALAAALLQTRGPVARVAALWREAHEAADRVGDAEGRLRALWGLCDYRTWIGDHRAALALAARIRAEAARTGNRVAGVAVERPTATLLRYRGDLAGARRAAERLLSRSTPRASAGRPERHGRSAARGTLANVLWLQGFADGAVAAARQALEEARAGGDPFAMMNALAHTFVPVALHVGDARAAEEALAMLSDHGARHGLRIWRSVGDCLGAILLLRRGDAEGLGRLREALDEMEATGFRMRRPAYLGSLASALGAHGQRVEARATIAEALAASDRSGETWCRPELLRIEGRLLAAEARAADAEARVREAIELAGRQGALAFALRAATSLAALRRAPDERALLAAIYGRFSEGFDTPDLMAARRCLGDAAVQRDEAAWPVALA
ncbi:hypothetical protein OPKNFCMD_5515 [Methylobacterium crusticola]|uniref:OmpR/PhoB-type domain-containing protein n=1 Tax=Methylobacterium crusticola TaxID=1697972 RepID=A0ABQ4R4X0_9HYPH|nr:winged helix-turn-helix domain-containing protein [Methylobacterium crusticola]GJD52748.1 hypothetical protein OPKNFCMD_5515 [Methylobacterium crusticola]